MLPLLFLLTANMKGVTEVSSNHREAKPRKKLLPELFFSNPHI